MANIPAAIAVIVTHCTAAAAALTNPFSDVANADPIPHTGRSIRVWWSGESDPIKMGGPKTLNSEMVGEVITITALWAVSDGGETLAASRDAEVFALKDQLRTRLHGDSQLGGNTSDIEIHYGGSEFIVYGNTLYRKLEFELVLDYSEYAIAP